MRAICKMIIVCLLTTNLKRSFGIILYYFPTFRVHNIKGKFISRRLPMRAKGKDEDNYFDLLVSRYEGHVIRLIRKLSQVPNSTIRVEPVLQKC